MKAAHKEKESDNDKTKHQGQQRQASPVIPRDKEMANSQTRQPDTAKNGFHGQTGNNVANGSGFPAPAHGPQTAYTAGSDLLYAKFNESYQKTRDLDHPETSKIEMEYWASLGANEALAYQDSRPMQSTANKESTAINKNASPELPLGKTAAPEEKFKEYTIKLKKGQKKIRNQEELNRYAESVMGITRTLRWTSISADYLKEILNNGAPIIYKLHIRTDDVKEETRSLTEDKKQFIQDAGSDYDYARNLRILDLLKQLSDEDIVDYHTKTTKETSSPAEIEASLKAYIAYRDKRKKEKDVFETVKAKLYGLDALYDRYIEFGKLSPTTTAYTSAEGAPIDVPNQDYNNEKQKLTTDLVANGFGGGIPEFESYIQKYETNFQKEAVRTAEEHLMKYRHLLFEEEKKLSDDNYIAKIFEARDKASEIYRAPTKDSQRKENMSDKEVLLRSAAPGNDHFAEMKAHNDQQIEMQVKNAQASSVLVSAAPLAKEKDFDMSIITGAKDAAALRKSLQAYINAKKLSIQETWNDIHDNASHIYELDMLFKSVYARQGITPESIYGKIIQRKVDEISRHRILKAICFIVISIAIIAATWGAATPWVIAGGVASFGMSAYGVYEAAEDYKRQDAANEVGLLTDDPSLVWVVLAIAGAALDAAALSSALKAAKPIADAGKAFNATADVAALEQQLGKIAGLDQRLQQNMIRQAKILAQERAVLQSFAKAKQLTYATIPGMFQTGELLARALFAVRKGIVTFDGFVIELKLARVVSESGLNAEELVLMKDAFGRAKTLANDKKLAEELEKSIETGDLVKLKDLGTEAEIKSVWPKSIPREPVTDLSSIQNGCEKVAKTLQKAIGGEILEVRPLIGNFLGPVRGMNSGWNWHVAVIKDGIVYDRMTGIKGLSFEDYVKLFDYAEPVGNLSSPIRFKSVITSNLK